MSKSCFELNQNTDFDLRHKDVFPFIDREKELHTFNLFLGYAASSCHVRTNALCKRREMSAAK